MQRVLSCSLSGSTRLVMASLILSLFIGVLPNGAEADLKVVTVDINRILNETPESKEAKAELDKLSMNAKKKIEKRRDALKDLEGSLKKKGIKEDSAEADEFRAKAREYSRFVKDTEEELRRKFLTSNKKLTSEILQLVEKYAKENNIDLVLDKSEEMRGPVLFGSASADITDDIIRNING